MPAMKKNMAGNFILVGLMGAGKTTLGKQLAAHYHYPFYDSDQVICARTGVDITTIFEMEGESGFRLRESHTIGELCSLKNIVLATGGGAVLSPENRAMLRQNGLVVYLHAQPETLLSRTCGDKNRPLLQVANPLQRYQELYAARDALYRETAHLIFEVNPQKSQQQTFEQLLNTIEIEKKHDFSSVKC